MTSHQLFKQGGYALIGAGLLIAFGMMLHPDVSDSHAAMHVLWSPTHLALIGGLILASFGVTGLFLRQAERVGWLGLGGFALLHIGIVLTIVAIVADAFIFPAVATSADGAALLDPAGPLLNGPLGLLFLSASVSYILGTLVLGGATLRAAVFPAGPAILMMIGGSLVALDPFVPQLVAKLGALLLGLSFVWFGTRLLGRPQRALLPEQAAVSR